MRIGRPGKASVDHGAPVSSTSSILGAGSPADSGIAGAYAVGREGRTGWG